MYSIYFVKRLSEATSTIRHSMKLHTRGLDMQNTKFPTGRKTKKANCRCFLLIAATLFLISGCAAQGAKRVPRDRFDYNAALAQSTREQMLLNIVRSRYQKVAVFLTVSSVLTQ